MLYQGEAVRWRRESPGTVVCVRDAFFNVGFPFLTREQAPIIQSSPQLPVRRLSHPSVAKSWELVRQEIEVYALVSPSVSFTLEDLQRNREDGVDGRTVRIPKVRTRSVRVIS